MEHIDIQTGADGGNYPILIGSDTMREIGEYLKRDHDIDKESIVGIVTDETVDSLWGDPLRRSLEDAGIPSETYRIRGGEGSKNMDTCMDIISWMQKNGFGGDSMLLACGGGVVGDITGFVSAIYQRGRVPYTQVPTSLLAQADASVGGKTGVNTETAKNCVGRIHHPSAVYIDVATLGTLPDEHMRNGLAETIKHALIRDASFFSFLEQHVGEVQERDPSALHEIGTKNCMIKGGVVMQDPYDSNYRHILNFGHTVGHAIEQESGYMLHHGEAVSIGMLVEGHIAHEYEMTGVTGEELERMQALLDAHGLPTRIPPDYGMDELMDRMRYDKKNERKDIRCTMPGSIGEMHHRDTKYAIPVNEETMQQALSALYERRD